MQNKQLKDLIRQLVQESKFGENSRAPYSNDYKSLSNSIVITYNQIFRNATAFWLSLILILAYILVPLSFASGGSTPNAFTKTGASWVDVTESDKIYFEPFGSNKDDYGIGYIASGDTCTRSGITVTGPALATTSDCTTSKIPLPFSMNFFGTTFNDTFITTNGNMSFDSDSGSYDISGFNYAANGPTSVISPLSLDLFYDYTDSNIWFAEQTIDGRSAFVFAWEDLHSCCDSNDASEKASFQLVIIEKTVGSGDFEAWFNFDKFEIGDQGYSAPTTFIDLNAGLTVGSNVYTVKQTTGITSTCTEFQIEDDFNLGSGNYPGGLDLSSNVYVKLLDADNNLVEIYTDSACTTGWTATSVGDLGTYVQIVDDSAPIDSVNVGWAGYRSSNNTISATEFFANLSDDTLVDSGSDPLIAKSLNTTVVGRFVLFMTGGDTYGDPDSGPGIDEMDGGGATSPTDATWVGEVSTACSDINPGEKEYLPTANKVVPRKADAKNLVGNFITQENLDLLGKANVIFDNQAELVKTATAVLPELGCADHLVKVKTNQSIQFIVGGFKLQSNAHGFLQTPDGAWHNLSSTTLIEDTAAFLHTVKFLQKGTYLIIITQQPAFSDGMPLPVLGINTARFKVEVSNKKVV